MWEEAEEHLQTAVDSSALVRTQSMRYDKGGAGVGGQVSNAGLMRSTGAFSPLRNNGGLLHRSSGNGSMTDINTKVTLSPAEEVSVSMAGVCGWCLWLVSACLFLVPHPTHPLLVPRSAPSHRPHTALCAPVCPLPSPTHRSLCQGLARCRCGWMTRADPMQLVHMQDYING
jgi:hypothetical protein